MGKAKVIAQLYYAAEDTEVFRIWETDPTDYHVVPGCELLNMLNAYKKLGIPCFNAARMLSIGRRIKRGECKHAV